jgi:hypothetical protein
VAQAFDSLASYDKTGAPFLRVLCEGAGTTNACGGFRHEQVNVFGHHHIADDYEAVTLAVCSRIVRKVSRMSAVRMKGNRR